MVKLEPETLVTKTAFAAVLSVATQLYVEVEVKAGLIAVMVTVDGVPEMSGALPVTTWPERVAVAEQVEVVPQNCTFGWLETVRFGTVVVEATTMGGAPVTSVDVNCPLALMVVNAPVPGVPLPIGPGAANVAPASDDAFKFGTLVVLAITNGAVPVASVEVICELVVTGTWKENSDEVSLVSHAVSPFVGT